MYRGNLVILQQISTEENLAILPVQQTSIEKCNNIIKKHMWKKFSNNTIIIYKGNE